MSGQPTLDGSASASPSASASSSNSTNIGTGTGTGTVFALPLPPILRFGVALNTTPPVLSGGAAARDPISGLLFVSGGFVDASLFAGSTKKASALDVLSGGSSSSSSSSVPNNFTAPCQQQLLVFFERTSTWFRLEKPMPVGLCGHSLSFWNNALWFVGGSTSVYLPNPNTTPNMNQNPPPYNSQIWSLNIRSDQPNWVQSTPSTPIQRYNHVAEVDPLSGTIYVFGGETKWLAPVNSMLAIRANPDGTATSLSPVYLYPDQPPRTQAAATRIMSNFNHTIMLIYGGYTTASTPLSLSLQPMSGPNSVFAFDMTNRTVASTYIAYFQPPNSDIQPPLYDYTIPEPTITTAVTSPIPSTTSTSTTAIGPHPILPSPAPITSPFPKKRREPQNAGSAWTPTISQWTPPPSPYPSLPSTPFSSLTNPTVMGPCLVDPTNCLNFALVGTPTGTGAYYYGGGQTNTSTTNQFWYLNTSIDGMWYWTNMNIPAMPSWWGVAGFARELGEEDGNALELEFILPFEDSRKTGGLVKYFSGNRSVKVEWAGPLNISDYYTQQVQPTGFSPSAPLAIGIALAVLVVCGAAGFVVYRRRLERRRRQEPYAGVATGGTPEPVTGGGYQGSPLNPRRSLFKMSTERIGATPTSQRKEEATGSSSSTLAASDVIPMNTISSQRQGQQQQQQQQPQTNLSPAKNRIIASWRVLTGVQAIVGPASSSSSGSSAAPPDSADSAEEREKIDEGLDQPPSVVTVPQPARSGFFRPPARTVTNAVVLGEHDLPSYESVVDRPGVLVRAASGSGDGIVDGEVVEARPAAPSGAAETNGSDVVLAGERQHAVCVGSHSPVGKDEIELRIGDQLTLLPDPSDNPHSSFIRGLNHNSGRTGLFPRHCIVTVSSTDPHHLASLGIPTAPPLTTDISWWREQAVRFNNALTNPASTNIVDASGGDSVEVSEKAGGGGGVSEESVLSPPVQPQRMAFVAPLVPVVTAAAVPREPTHQVSRGSLASGFAAPARAMSASTNGVVDGVMATPLNPPETRGDEDRRRQA